MIERARARWEESPKHPAYQRPAPPPRRRNRRGQETAQAANAEDRDATADAAAVLRLERNARGEDAAWRCPSPAEPICVGFLRFRGNARPCMGCFCISEKRRPMRATSHGGFT